jgi:uncharacterized protein
VRRAANRKDRLNADLAGRDLRFDAPRGIALFEYLLMVPASRIGYTELSLAQLKILQEAITLAVFVPFAILYMNQPVKLDYLWAALCIMGAVYFIFRG